MPRLKHRKYFEIKERINKFLKIIKMSTNIMLFRLLQKKFKLKKTTCKNSLPAFRYGFLFSSNIIYNIFLFLCIKSKYFDIFRWTVSLLHSWKVLYWKICQRGNYAFYANYAHHAFNAQNAQKIDHSSKLATIKCPNQKSAHFPQKRVSYNICQ